jgi:endonuclease/exonuclease/phosphatase family metal-dependent hydrolase
MSGSIVRHCPIASQRRFLVLAGTLLLLACQTQKNYVATEGPRHHGAPPPHFAEAEGRDTLKVVSFNVEFARQVERALAVLAEDSDIRDADIILLQEMDAPGTRYIARSLGMWYVYYPATRHLLHGRDFGNAVLSRWPIVADRKLILPHPARLYRTVRTATGTTIRVGQDSVRVYSAHLGTVVNVNAVQRREQLQTILDDAAAFDKVIIGGDLNDARVANMAEEQGYSWPTRDGPPTATIGRLDHILVKGLSIPETDGSGTVLDARGASDHRPVWVHVILRNP